jgi:hypothetical protein
MKIVVHTVENVAVGGHRGPGDEPRAVHFRLSRRRDGRSFSGRLLGKPPGHGEKEKHPN